MTTRPRAIARGPFLYDIILSMIITYHGGEFVKIQQGDLVIAFNPPAKGSKLSGPRFGADIVCITTNHPDMNGIESVTRKEKQPFAITGPGEYEVAGLFIEGFAGESMYDKKERVNTIYTLEVDNMRIGFLGAISGKDISPAIKEKMGDIDILFVPIGGIDVLDPQDAYQLAVKREPKIIIPIHYGSIGEKDALKKFLKEGGSEGEKPVEKLTIKRKDIDSNSGDIVVLKETN